MCICVSVCMSVCVCVHGINLYTRCPLHYSYYYCIFPFTACVSYFIVGGDEHVWSKPRWPTLLAPVMLHL